MASSSVLRAQQSGLPVPDDVRGVGVVIGVDEAEPLIELVRANPTLLLVVTRDESTREKLDTLVDRPRGLQSIASPTNS